LTLQWDNLSDFADGQQQLQRLHYLQDRLFGVSPRLRATLEIISTLKAIKGAYNSIADEGKCKSLHHLEQFLDDLESYKTQAMGLLDSARSLERRMEGILMMVSLILSNDSSSYFSCWENDSLTNTKLSAALNLRHQETGIGISQGVLSLTNETVDDSATVRVITFVTLLYLPASFVAVSLGTIPSRDNGTWHFEAQCLTSDLTF
jgi:hypothetical protein